MAAVIHTNQLLLEAHLEEAGIAVTGNATTQRLVDLEKRRSDESSSAAPTAQTVPEVIAARRRWVAGRADAFSDCYLRVSAGEAARMTYRSSVPLPEEDSVEATAAAFTDALADSGEREARMGVTVVGPHRDDVRLQLASEASELDLRDYGSGGQRRTAALALRLVEAQTIRDRRSRKPRRRNEGGA